MDHGGFSAVDPFDPVSNKSTVRNEMIHTFCGFQIVFPEIIFENGHSDLAAQSGITVIIFVHIPQIPHGGMAVADMGGMRRFPDPFCRTGFAGEDQIVLRKIQFGKCAGHQRQIFLTVDPCAGQFPDECFIHGVFRDRRFHFVVIIRMGINIRIRIKFTEFREDVFAAAHIHKPVVKECSFHGFYFAPLQRRTSRTVRIRI